MYSHSTLQGPFRIPTENTVEIILLYKSIGPTSLTIKMIDPTSLNSMDKQKKARKTNYSNECCYYSAVSAWLTRFLKGTELLFFRFADSKELTDKKGRGPVPGVAKSTVARKKFRRIFSLNAGYHVGPTVECIRIHYHTNSLLLLLLCYYILLLCIILLFVHSQSKPRSAFICLFVCSLFMCFCCIEYNIVRAYGS